MRQTFSLPGAVAPVDSATKRPRTLLRKALGRRLWQSLDEETRQRLSEMVVERSRNASELATLSAITTPRPYPGGESVRSVLNKGSDQKRLERVSKMLSPSLPTGPG
jgi:hypothetical protein